MSAPSTPNGWNALREKVKQSVILQRTPAQTIELRLCALLTFLSGVLYAASFVKRRSGGMWMVKKDAQGYYHPNVHTALPLFAALYAILDVSAVLFIEKTLNHPVDPIPVVLQLVAYQALQVFAWVKIWATLYALLSSRLRHQTNTIAGNFSRTRKLVSPRIFNTFLLGTIIVVLIGQIPLIALLSLSIVKFRRQFWASDSLLEQASFLSAAPNTDDPTIITLTAVQTILNLQILDEEGGKANRLLLAYIIFTIAWMSFNIFIFSVSTTFLLHALRTQKNILSSALENRKVLKLIQKSEKEQINVRHSYNSWVFCSSDEGCTRTTRRDQKSFDPWTWKSWIDFAKDESLTTGDAFWNRVNMLNLPARASRANLEDAFVVGELSKQVDHSAINDAALEMHCATTTRYWYSTMGQTIVGIGMFSAYLIMGCRLFIRSPQSSGKDELIEAFIWSNWTWGGGPGILLGIVACIVAFSSTPTLPQGSKLQALDVSIGGNNNRDSATHHERAETQRSGALPISKNELESILASGSRATPAQQEDNLSLSSSAWRNPSIDSCRTDNNPQVLGRQASFSSSIFSYQTAHHESLYKPSNEDMPWGAITDSSQQENLVQTEWMGSGHFKAIKGLREAQ
ncbi:hypothetical protein PtA15_9A629 [Puccinia triticina]|uniref:CSC1/OSCA1-like 7TM region domain-containing protein n=1 Tax=Puccinia triticina TaxID=208348 RepID=A0ABY7CWY0_9BASI|nr:uncharacterized protein PtA15_9A629 [Puccinia triticina]WAQ88502.1 hypothetical protein PtA15_9A629 [Puccinia triticina]WAR60677.1 hypothetical protein PtB15_9B616 [Puccinia triticina]